MDRRDPSRFDYTQKRSASNESIERQQDTKQDQVERKIISSDFWTSRGNMGEKINILIGLNLQLINIISSLVQILSRENTLSEDMRISLEMTKEFLSKITIQPDSGLEILKNLETIDTKVTTLMEGLNTGVSPIAIEKEPQDAPEKIFGFFQRNAVYLDKWGIIDSIDNLQASYSNLSHLGFPNYYSSACRELHRYEIQQNAPFYSQSEIIQLPSFKLRDLISKLLREAPAARLLQNLRKIFPAEHDSALTSTEQDKIQKIVEMYYKCISEYFNETRSLQDSLRISSGILKNYNLGTGDLESRIPNVSFNIVKEISLDLQNAKDDELRRYILSETIILIHRLNDSLLQTERFVLFLRRLK
ncbi:MAG: hypothetical protein JSW11_03440 [Candidatus Heimdallarchaeota archaeon]|nr:MAG: hypothetical protein JSW11_03440 [Candidatus Heimdallarchaeota archaeon]